MENKTEELVKQWQEEITARTMELFNKMRAELEKVKKQSLFK